MHENLVTFCERSAEGIVFGALNNGRKDNKDKGNPFACLKNLIKLWKLDVPFFSACRYYYYLLPLTTLQIIELLRPELF